MNKLLNLCIMQLKHNPETGRLLFASMAELQRWGVQPKMENYYKVWFEDHSRDEEPAYDYDNYEQLLEELFEIFNVQQPKGFIGRSLSVGDMIAVTEERNGLPYTMYFYVDAIGFEQLTEF